MEFLSEKELLGKFTPQVYTSKITLEPANPQTPLRRDPHVKPLIVGATLTSGMTETSRYALDIDDSSGAPLPTPTQLNVTINMTVKDVLYDLQASWFNNINFTRKTGTQSFDLKNYIKIYCGQLMSAGDFSTAMTAIRNNPAGLKNLFGVDDIKMKTLSEVVGSVNDVLSQVVATESAEIIENRRRVSSIVQQSTQLNLKNIPYNVTFGPIENPNPNFLAYVTWTEFDLQQIAVDYDFDIINFASFQNIFNVKYYSKKMVDKVIEGGKVINTAYIFRDKSGVVWNGPNPVQINSNRYWTGRWYQISDGAILNAVEAATVRKATNGQFVYGQGYEVPVKQEIVFKKGVKNTKIQDFRTVERVEKLNLDLSTLENKLKPMLSGLKFSRMLDEYKNKSNKNFSTMNLTRDLNNNCRFIFSMRLDKILEQNSLFGNLYKNPRTKDAVVAGSKIISLRLHRIRLKGSPEMGSKPLYISTAGEANDRPRKFYDNEPSPPSFMYMSDTEQTAGSLPVGPASTQTTDGDELLLEYKPTGLSSGDIVQFDGVSTIRSFNGTLIYATDNMAQRAIKYFTGVDRSVKNKTDGFYQYKVTLEIKDGAPDLLVNLIAQLRNAQTTLGGYYAEASRLGSPGANNPYENPHVQQSGDSRGLIQPNDPRPANFNVLANRFTQHFINTQQNAWGARLADSPWNVAATTYSGIISRLANLDSSEQQEIKNSLIDYMSPWSGNIEGILIMFKLLEELQQILLKAIKGLRPVKSSNGNWALDPGEGNYMKVQGNQIVASNIQDYGPPKISTIKTEYRFQSIFDANMPKNVGLNILGIDIADYNSNGGLLTIPGTDFTNMVANETKKIFSNDRVADWDATGLIWIRNIPEVGKATTYNVGDGDMSYFTPTIINTLSGTVKVGGVNSNPQMLAADASRWVNDFSSEQRTKLAQDIEFSISSFVGTNFNLTVVPENEVQVPIIPPGPQPTSNQVLVNDRNTHYDTLRDEQKELNRDAYSNFTEILGNLNVNGATNVSSISLRALKNNDLELYKPSNPAGHLAKWGLMDPTLPDAQQPTLQMPDANGVLQTIDIRSFMSILPNQVKALFSIASKPVISGGGLGLDIKMDLVNALRGRSRGNSVGGITDWNQPKEERSGGRALTRYVFETIYTLEVFTGYEMITEDVGAGANKDVPSLIEKKWVPLTRTIYGNAHTNNQFLLCRFRPYENSIAGISVENELPLYEQYFMIQPGNVPPRVQEDTQEDDFAREAAEAEQERTFTEFLEAGAEFDPRLEALAEQLGAGGADAFAAGGDFGGLGALFGSDTDTGDEQEQGSGGFGQGFALASEVGGGLADGIQAVTGPAEGIQGGIIGGGGTGGRGGYGE
jgi:hypothetical protein